MHSALVHSRPTISGGSELYTDDFPGVYKRVEVHSLVSSAAVQFTPVLLLLPKLQAWCRCYLLFFLTTLHIIMFLKTVLTFLAIGALSVNALTAPVARSPTPEPECEFPRSFSITSYHDLTLVLFNSPRTRGLDAQARPFIRAVFT